MANATRIKIAQSSTIYNRVTANNDFDVHDVATNESLVANRLGSSVDIELDSDDDITYVENNQLVTTIDELNAGAESNTSCTAFIWIKHSGFQDAAKTTATADDTVLKIHFQNDANHYISLFPGESIIFHHPGTALDQVNNYWATSGTGTVYAEVICAAK
jgi:hypothetical protein